MKEIVMDFIDGYGLILIDGQRIMGCGQSGGMGEYGTGLNQISIDLIERVEVVKSAEDIREYPVKSDRHSFMGKLDADISESIDLYLKYELSDYEKADSRQEESYRVSAGIDFRPADDHFFSLKGYTYTWDFTHGYPGYSYGYKHGDVGYNQCELQYTWYSSDWNILTLGGELQRQGIDYIIENLDGSMVNVKKTWIPPVCMHRMS